MVALSRGLSTKSFGMAHAMISAPRLSSASSTAPWRFHAASFGTTRRSLLLMGRCVERPDSTT